MRAKPRLSRSNHARSLGWRSSGRKLRHLFALAHDSGASQSESIGNELPGSILFVRRAGHRGTGHLSSHPSHDAREDSLQLADVSPALATAHDAAEPAGESFPAAAPLPCLGVAGVRVCPPVSPEADGGRRQCGRGPALASAAIGFWRNGRANPSASKPSTRQRNSRRNRFSNRLRLVRRGGEGWRNISELKGIFSRVVRRMR